MDKVEKPQAALGRLDCDVAAAIIAAAFLLTPHCVQADKAEDQFNFATGLFIEADYELAVAEYKAFLNRYGRHALVGKAQFQEAVEAGALLVEEGLFQ